MYIADAKLCQVINFALKFFEVFAELVKIEHNAHHLFREIPGISTLILLLQRSAAVCFCSGNDGKKLIVKKLGGAVFAVQAEIIVAEFFQ